MVEVVAGLLASAVVKIAADKLSSAIAEQASLAWHFRKDLKYMRDTMESMGALFNDAEKQSVKNESVRLWLERLKYAAVGISDMMDDYQDTATKMPRMLAYFLAPHKMMILANEMNNMRENLKNIYEQHQQYGFKNIPASQEQHSYDERRTTPAVNKDKILGRDEEKKKIMDILSARHREDGTMVLPIYGLGGIGKSTLAQLIYNDSQFKTYQRVWVYVSKAFDLEEIRRSIISKISTPRGEQNTETDLIQCLHDLLPDKKILIILDDIWEEDAFKLEKLKDMLGVDKKGSMVDVLVTTRSEKTANRICTNMLFKLEPLAQNFCWDIIKRCSRFDDKSSKPRLKKIGLDIAKKCGGVPLAAQALGYILQSKDLNGWLEVNNSDIWNENFEVHDQQHMKVLSSLKLSYERMLPILRLCFSYCAIFPKGHHICEDDLVHQWIALDFIKKPSEGKEYINQLLGMSFLEHSKLPTNSKENVRRYTMHDLVHELARSVVGDYAIVIDAAGEVKTNKVENYRYALLVNYDGQKIMADILPKNVRALHFSSRSKIGSCDGSFSFVKNLRVLDLSEFSGIHLPSSICQLKHLKCLIAPELQDMSLPKAIGQLSKLQYLNLSGSSLLSTLPKSIGKLSCLIYLCLSGCSGISKIPSSFGRLKTLMHLDMSNCSGVGSLPGTLRNLTNLQYLDLSNCSSLEEIPESLNGLNNLQHLNLSHCDSIRRLPEAIGSFKNLQYLYLKSTRRITDLPVSFQNLQNLVHLDLSGCCANGLPEPLRGLTTLEHLNMSAFTIDNNLQKDLSDAVGNLTNLKYLNMGACGIDRYLDFISTLTNLEHLDLSWNSGIVSLPDSLGNLKKLLILDLSGCHNLKSIPESIREITILKSLLIEGCSEELIDWASSKLHFSLTLPRFKVRPNDADVANASSNLPLLRDTNISELIIHSLEHVKLEEEARKVKMSEKYKLLDLELSWTSLNADRFVDDKDLLEQLVPPGDLKSLSLKNYISQSFPNWFMDISNHLPNLVSITLIALPKCNKLPPLGQLPNLEELSISQCDSIRIIGKDFYGGEGAFPRLSKFILRRMQGLEKWCTKYSIEELMFPMLDKLEVNFCPKLRLTPCAPICRDCKINRSNEIISSLEELDNNNDNLTMASFTKTTTLTILSCDCKSLRLFHHFTALQELEIFFCNQLRSLPDNMRHLTSLQSLKLELCNSIPELPEWFGDLSSLKTLTIESCGGIKSLPPCIRRLKELQTLRICDNTELMLWCKSEKNKKKLAHINNQFYD